MSFSHYKKNWKFNSKEIKQKKKIVPVKENQSTAKGKSKQVDIRTEAIFL